MKKGNGRKVMEKERLVCTPYTISVSLVALFILSALSIL